MSGDTVGAARSEALQGPLSLATDSPVTSEADDLRCRRPEGCHLPACASGDRTNDALAGLYPGLLERRSVVGGLVEDEVGQHIAVLGYIDLKVADGVV